MSFSCSDFQEAIVAELGIGDAIEKAFADDPNLPDDAGPAVAFEEAIAAIRKLKDAQEALAEVACLFAIATTLGHPFSVALKRARRIAIKGQL